MYSLFRVNYNPTLFLVTAVIIRLLFFNLSWYSYLAIVISLHQFFLVFYSIGHVIPIRYLLGIFMCLQMFIGPVFAYNGLDKYQYVLYKMQVPESEYFTYAIPAVIFFIIGLHVAAGQLQGELVDIKKIQIFINKRRNIPYIFIIGGFISSVLTGFFSSNLAFVFYLLGGFKFIGIFLLILSSERLKIIPLIVVFASVISSSLGQAMFHDLLIWLIFTGIIFAIKLKPSTNFKVIVFSSFVVLVVLLQLVKEDYRTATWKKKETGGVETFVKAFETGERNNAFSFNNLAFNNVRINQGYIITYILKTVPHRIPFSKGEELRDILEAAFLPRFLAPNKLVAGSQHLFNKYTGLTLSEGTSMALSSVGDAYLNFGIIGGCIFMFLMGLLFNGILKLFHKYGKTYPILILFTTLAFYYPIRADSELQTNLGHLVKSCILIFIIILIWKNYFRVHQSPS